MDGVWFKTYFVLIHFNMEARIFLYEFLSTSLASRMLLSLLLLLGFMMLFSFTSLVCKDCVYPSDSSVDRSLVILHGVLVVCGASVNQGALVIGFVVSVSKLT